MDNLITIQRAQPAPPCTVVIFGASGDLAKRKLIPSLYNLVACGEGMMPAKSAVVGFARREMSIDEFRKSAHDWTVQVLAPEGGRGVLGEVCRQSRLPVRA